MRIAIVDDEQHERQVLQNYVMRYAAENHVEFDIDLYSLADELLNQYQIIYDILIFDIDMPGTNGIEAARKIRLIDKNTILLFITNIAQYAINGYEVDAVDYIIKPIGYFDFSLKFQKAVNRASHRNDFTTVLSTTEGLRKVKVSEIAYVEAMRHYLIYHIGFKSYTVRGNIKDLERKLHAYHFCQIHKSFLVNMDHIVEIQTNEVLLENAVLPIGRVYKDALVSHYFKFFRG